VTNEQFAQFVAQTGYVTTSERDRPRHAGESSNGHTWRTYAKPTLNAHPVVCVSWHDAVEYARWVNKRLPTEAEWEKAARGGLTGRAFPWGDTPPTDDQCRWNQAGREGVPTIDAMRLIPNALGVHGMVGNAWEWCADWYGEDYYARSPRDVPAGPERGEYKVRRGGAWNVRETFRLRCSNRGAMSPDASWPNLGFRCALDAPR
jgi:formylglycine-generating enzyme